MSAPYRFQNAGRDLQKSLLSEWYRGLSAANGEGVPVAYLFISGNVAELLRAFGFRLGYPEVNALQCGIKKAAGPLILRAEEEGYSSDVCGYVKNDLGLLASGGRAPFGDLPRPDLLVCTYSGCTTYVKWFEALAERTGARLVFLDVPYLRDRDALASDRAYVVRQLEELIGICEEVTGRRFEEAKLREICALSRRAEESWTRILESAKRRPSPFDAYFEAVFFMAPLYVLRGTEACARYYESALAEIEERIEHGLGPVPEERFRVVLEGPPPWPHFRAFWELFKRWGVVSVASTYSKVGGLFDQGVRHDPERPLESIAEHAIHCYTNWNLGLRRDLIGRYLREYDADALVFHSVKSCRSFSVGQADTREAFSRERGVPTLFLESDLADPRYFSEAQMRNRIDAFFEALEHRRLAPRAEARP
ncbi:MAG TPA: 2-hydroxyacyl-CoA dehydratase family protein [Planctomycetota bacterium]|nr:2-hydroxyacyl-CoA dehydratase family protein [Planctomycetota bacterium]